MKRALDILAFVIVVCAGGYLVVSMYRAGALLGLVPPLLGSGLVSWAVVRLAGRRSR